MRATKCATCLDTLHFVRPSSRCAGKFLKYYRADKADVRHRIIYSVLIHFVIECGLVCHVKCAPNLPRTCGLPSEFVDHFTETLQEQKNDKNDGKSQSTTRLGGRREGWLRVPRYADLFVKCFLK